MKKFLLLTLLTCSCSITAVACSKDNSSGAVQSSQSNTSESISESAYELLNENEKIIFDALIVNINNFHSPVDVKVLEIRSLGFESFTSIKPDISWQDCFLRIMSKNGMGATTTEWYRLTLEDYEDTKKGDISEVSLMDGNVPMFSYQFDYAMPANINKALTEHWEELGLL